ncbi:flavodoxin [Methanobacterium sp. SMA-27]|uniref:flavodoxin family protein n=1 Tax=Methanobacterium sp. SMA-27 TaxID=1495336 RepID=UPI00064EF324|nr:flavodoxin [Methanobacterium sp. SMA-27]
MKTVILYYSRTRKTAHVAKTLADEIQADITEVMDLKDRMGVVNYLGSSIDALRENKTIIKPDTFDLSEYGLVYIGTPTWAAKPAPAIITMIDKCNLKGKDIILFSTMGSSGGSKAIERMREKVEARGGRLVNSFSIKTGGKEIEDINNETKKISEEMDLKIYGI